LLLLLLVIVLYGFFVSPLYGKRDALQEQLSAQARFITPNRPKAPERHEQLEAFYANFASEDQMAAILGDLHDAAPRRNLSLPQGGYRLVGADSIVDPIVGSRGQVSSTGEQRSLKRYAIVLPVKGNFHDISGYVSDVLMKQSGIALDSLTFTRENSIRIGVEAELHFTLYVRSGA
jgi:hypothetical protein